MITIEFKSVGQGDSIIIEWQEKGKKHIGIIDCNIINGTNPTLNYIKNSQVKEVEFIILTHFHYDHFSGFADLFDYLFINKIETKIFYHTMSKSFYDLYDKIFRSQKIQNAAVRFINTFDIYERFITNLVEANCYTKNLNMSDEIYLSFLAPDGKMYKQIIKQAKMKENQITTTNADINLLSTIISIESKEDCIILTSDAVKKSFKKLINKINKNVIFVQAPHHGSYSNICPEFWTVIKKQKSCPCIFSVGDEPKDKLPNKETVSFFIENNFDIFSTDIVYGIKDYFGFKTSSNQNANCLNSFSRLIKVKNNSSYQNSKFVGDQKFELL